MCTESMAVHGSLAERGVVQMCGGTTGARGSDYNFIVYIHEDTNEGNAPIASALASQPSSPACSRPHCYLVVFAL